MAERQLVGAEAESAPEQLVAEADSEERQPRTQHSPKQLHMIVGCRGVSWAVRVEDRTRPQRKDFGGCHGLRKHVHIEAAGGEVAQRGLLHPQIEHRDRADPLARRFDVPLRGHRDLCGEVAAGHRCPLAHDRELLGFDERGIGTGKDAGPHRASIAKSPGDGTGIDAADADDSLLDELVVEAPVRAMVRDNARRVPHCETRDPDA